MYQQYYGFTRAPFRLESEPDMFFFGETQTTVLANIKASLSAGKGITTLSGLPGTGKTTIMRRAMEESIAPHTAVCRIDRGQCSDFIETLKKEILVRQPAYSEDNLTLVDLDPLVDKAVTGGNKDYLIVVDEAHKLLIPELDELLRLASLETGARRRLKFLLISHKPLEYFEFSKEKNDQNLFSVHCALEPLSSSEIFPYVYHRLENSGWKNIPEFSSNIQQLVFKVTQGIPRRINSFFDRLMLFSFFESRKKIDLDFVKLFCRDLSSELNDLSNPDLDSFALWQGLKLEAPLFSESNNRGKIWLFAVIFGLASAGGLAYIYLDSKPEPDFFPVERAIENENQVLLNELASESSSEILPVPKVTREVIEKNQIIEHTKSDSNEKIIISPKKEIVSAPPIVLEQSPPPKEKTPDSIKKTPEKSHKTEAVIVIAPPSPPVVKEEKLAPIKLLNTTVKQTPTLPAPAPILPKQKSIPSIVNDNKEMPFIIKEEKPSSTPVVIKPPVQRIPKQIVEQTNPNLPTPVPFFKLTQAPRFLHREKPVYPEAMIGIGTTGVVKLEALIDNQGQVRDVTIIKSAGKHFDEAAKQAAYASRFLPAKVAQEAVAVRLKFPVRFGAQ